MATTQKGIYYNNDYSAAADILEDERKMAESVDDALDELDNNKVDKVAGKSLISDAEIERLANVDNYDDTEVQNAISNIEDDVEDAKDDIANIDDEQTVQKTAIEDLKVESENLKSIVAQLPQVTGQGTEVTLEDTIEAPFTKFETEGHSEQETTEGRNKFSKNSGTQTNNGITTIISNNNVFSLNGTSTSGANWFTLDKTNITLPAGTYTFSANYDKGTINSSGNILMFLRGSGATTNLCSISLPVSTTPVKSASFTIEQETSIDIYGYCAANIVISNYSMKLQLETGSTATTYEPYTNGASPSPNWEQPIYSAGDNVNLFDLDNIATVGPVTASLTKLDKDTFRLTALSTGNNQANIFRTLDLTNYAGKYLTIQAFVKSSSTNPAQIILRQNNYDYSGTKSNEVYNDSKITTDGIIEHQYKVADTITDANRYLFIVSYATRNMVCEIGDYVDYKIKIEPGSTATPYSPYGMGSITEKIVNKNFLEITEDTFLARCTYVSGANTNEYKLLCTNPDMYVNEIRAVGNKWNKEANGNLIPCKYGETIYYDIGNSLFTNIYFSEYDENLISLGYYLSLKSSGTYTPKNSSCKYVTFSFGYGRNAVAGTTYTLAPIVSKTPSDSYVPYKEQTYSIHTQQPFRSIEDVRDVFFKNVKDSKYYNKDLEENKWYERHCFGKVNQLSAVNGPYAQGFFIIPEGIKKGAKLLSTHQQLGTKAESEEWQRFDGSQMKQLYPQAHNEVYINYKAETQQEQVAWWNSLNATLLYELETPINLPCTEEQIEILENPPKTYAGQTNIYSEDEVEALVKAKGIYDMNKLITRVEVIESEV